MPPLGAPARRTGSLDDVFDLETAGEHLWRVCDARFPFGQGRFVAFIEEKNDEFEVMQLADDFVWTRFPTLREALEHVAQTAGGVLSEGPAWDLGWVR